MTKALTLAAAALAALTGVVAGQRPAAELGGGEMETAWSGLLREWLDADIGAATEEYRGVLDRGNDRGAQIAAAQRLAEIYRVRGDRDALQNLEASAATPDRRAGQDAPREPHTLSDAESTAVQLHDAIETGDAARAAELRQALRTAIASRDFAISSRELLLRWRFSFPPTPEPRHRPPARICIALPGPRTRFSAVRQRVAELAKLRLEHADEEANRLEQDLLQRATARGVAEALVDPPTTAPADGGNAAIVAAVLGALAETLAGAPLLASEEATLRRAQTTLVALRDSGKLDQAAELWAALPYAAK